LLAEIEADHRDRGDSVSGVLIFLGDLIDRGPQSAQVVERVRSGPLPGFRTIALAGNHEEVLVRLLDEDEPGLCEQWLRFGGRECLESYGENTELLAVLPEQEALGRIRAAIPAEHQAFLRELGDSFSLGDYIFVHAGLRPGISLEQQSTTDLRWIRKAFLDDPRDHGAMVVHGHTITPEIDKRRNRIGIDTGAFCFGVLTALCLENEERWYLQHRLTPEPAGGEFRG
jgi:serine/threonine protein phosphatase 1